MQQKHALTTAPVDIDGLRSFVAVGESLSFAAAAERLGVSASALTRRVQRLEAMLGTALLERSTRRVSLSPAGRVFLPLARQVLDDLNAAVQLLRDDARGRAEHLTLASLPTVTAHLLPRIIRDYRARWPKIHLRVIECGAAAVVQNVREGTAEFGFTFQAGWETDLAFDPILIDPYCVIMPVGHPLAAQQAVAWRELKRHAVITAGPTSGNMLLLKDALRGIDWISDTAYEIDHLTTSLGMVEAGLGIAAVPQSALPDASHDRMVVRPLVDPAITRTLGMFRRRDQRLTASAQQFLMTARHIAQVLGATMSDPVRTGAPPGAR